MVVCELVGRNTSEHRGGPERHDAKADPAWTGGRLVRVGNRTTRPTRFAGVVDDSMPTRNDGEHGKPSWVADRFGQQSLRVTGSDGWRRGSYYR